MGRLRNLLDVRHGPIGRLGLIPRFAIVGALVLTLLWVALITFEKKEHRAGAVADNQAEIALAAARASEPAGMGSSPSAAEVRVMNRVLRSALPKGARFRIWGRSRNVLFTGRPRPTAPSRSPTQLPKALRGSATTEERGARLVTFAPIGSLTNGRASAAVEAQVPAKTVLAPEQDIRLQAIVLGIALLVLWGVLLAVVAVTSRGLRTEAASKHDRALKDALTGLPNRTAFRELVSNALVSARRQKKMVGVMLMDLDRFKEINDTLGHYNGDLLLQRIGPRITGVLRNVDTVARLGGDEFAVLIPGVPDQEVVSAAAERIIKALEEPFVLGGLALSIEASIGIGLYPEHGNKVDTILQRADTAMYGTKAAHDGFRFYTDEDDQSSRRKLALVGELRRAVEEKEIVLFYQPKASLSTGQVVGVEALARWNHPQRGLLAPDEFIPLLEQTNLLKPFTAHIVDTALAQIRQWRLDGREIPVAVNLSMRNLLDGDLVADLREMLNKWSVDPSMLELELTETTVMSEPRRTLAALQALGELGVALSVDDFGTGYSSLAYLRDLPIDRIKIDKSFVMTMEEDPKNLAIVRSTIDLGRNLGLEVVAEGVETATACATLAALGCDYAQGYVLTRPVSAAQLTPQLAEMVLPLPEPVEPSLTAVAGGRVA